MFDGLINPFAASSSGGPNTPGVSEDVTFELGGGPDKLQGSRAERRYVFTRHYSRSLIARDSFAALNPHGALDFYLPGEGNISEYVGM
jgi:hypothetical protein